MTPDEAKGFYEALLGAYKLIPQEVLDDIERFVRPEFPSFVTADPGGRQTAFNEGMRSIWLHIQKRRNMTYQDIESLAQTHLKIEEARS